MSLRKSWRAPAKIQDDPGYLGDKAKDHGSEAGDKSSEESSGGGGESNAAEVEETLELASAMAATHMPN